MFHAWYNSNTYLNTPTPLFMGLCDALPRPRVVDAAAADDAGSAGGSSTAESSFKTLRLTFIELR